MHLCVYFHGCLEHKRHTTPRHLEEEEEGLFKAKAMNEVDPGHDRATPALVRRKALRACVICDKCLRISVHLCIYLCESLRCMYSLFVSMCVCISTQESIVVTGLFCL